MKRRNNLNKGITLIALVITIIVLLILAGIVINLTIGENGILIKTKQAGQEYETAQIKEELELAILDIEAEKLSKGQEMTREDLAKLANIGATMESLEIPAEGEYKDYYFEVDEDYKVTIIGKIQGEKPNIQYEILTEGIVVQGGTIEIKLTASISEGDIATIEAINGAILKTQTSKAEKIFEVSKNGIYYFKATAENGRSAIAVVEINIIQEKPEITIKNIQEETFTIEVTNNYAEGMVTEYRYYIDETLKSSGTQDKEFVVTDLWDNTEYNIYVEAYFGTEKLTSDEKTVTTKELQGKVYLYKSGNEYEELTGGFGFQGFSNAYDKNYYADGASTSNFDINKNDNLLTIRTYRSGYGFFCRTNNAIDFGNGKYSKLIIKYKECEANYNNSSYGIWNSKTNFASFIKIQVPANGEATYKLDVSDVTSSVYVGFKCASGETAVVEEIYLVEK